MFDATSSQGSDASSWNTTPTPSGTLPAIVLPSNATVPSLVVARPAITSSSVDLPQPDGPTTAKNSPRAISRSTGPSASTGPVRPRPPKTLRTPRKARCGSATALLHRLLVVGQEARVPELVVVDVAGVRADRPLRLDHALEARLVDLAFAPVRHAG